MKVGLFQFSPDFGMVQQNLERIECVVRETDADLIVLPELCTTGYQFISKDEVDALSEPIPSGPSVQRLIGLCEDNKCYLAAGLAEKDGNFCYNSAVLLGPEGCTGIYRKIHLFDEEKTWFKEGNLGPGVWDIGSAKIGLMVCFDWIFPEMARSLALLGADIICHPANLVLPYCQDAAVTRSVENRVFFILANRIGQEEREAGKRLTFTGGSEVVAPDGQILFRMGRNEEKVQIVEMDPTRARDKQITGRNHLWEDRRPDLYVLNKKGET